MMLAPKFKIIYQRLNVETTWLTQTLESGLKGDEKTLNFGRGLHFLRYVIADFSDHFITQKLRKSAPHLD